MSYRNEMLKETMNIVSGNRDIEYGKPENSFSNIAKLWNAYLAGIDKLTSVDVANMMVLLKIARAKGSANHADNFIDIAGYAACAYDIIKETENNKEGKV